MLVPAKGAGVELDAQLTACANDASGRPARRRGGRRRRGAAAEPAGVARAAERAARPPWNAASPPGASPPPLRRESGATAAAARVDRVQRADVAAAKAGGGGGRPRRCGAAPCVHAQRLRSLRRCCAIPLRHRAAAAARRRAARRPPRRRRWTRSPVGPPRRCGQRPSPLARSHQLARLHTSLASPPHPPAPSHYGSPQPNRAQISSIASRSARLLRARLGADFAFERRADSADGDVGSSACAAADDGAFDFDDSFAFDDAFGDARPRSSSLEIGEVALRRGDDGGELQVVGSSGFAATLRGGRGRARRSERGAPAAEG